MPRRVRAAVLGALSAALLFTVPAVAAPAPTAGTDTMRAWPRGTTDVLANDTGAGELSVTSTGQPGHGTARCAPLGGCLYKADDGYTGPDTFIYTLRDGEGGEATGTVTVKVETSKAGTTLNAADDDAATTAGHAVVVKVLDNDSGQAPLQVSGATTPTHGTASCDAGGACTYTPDAGYTGSDGFRYTLAHAGPATSTADVHVLVIPADARYSFGLHGGPSSVPAGGSAGWAASVAAGFALEELAALPLPETTVALTGPHGTRDGTITTAKGWTAGADGAHAAAGHGALLGDAITEAFPQPLPPISQGTGGDGHVPILVGSKVLAFYHHSFRTSATCVDRRTGSVCPGYPIPLDFGTTNINGPGVVIGPRLYTHLITSQSHAQSAPIGLFCWDTATNDTCGYHVLARLATAGDPGASAPVLVGRRIYMAGDGGRLYCLDPDTDEPCGSIATGLSGAESGEYDIVTHGTRVYVSRLNDVTACVDVAAGAPCEGWSAPKATGNAWNVVNQHNASGATVGVCMVGGGHATCLPDADPSAPTVIDAFVPFLDDYYDVTQEAEAGTRTFFGSLFKGGVGCWDWAAGARCAGPGFDAQGWATQQTGSGSLPLAYGAAWDGSCAVALGDPGKVFTVDADGTSPCTSLSSGTNKRTVDLRDQRCDGGVGAARWRSVTLSDVGPGELQSVVVSVRDADSGEVLASGEMIGNGSLDLSSIDPKQHPRVTLDANARGPEGNPAWTDAIPPRLRLAWAPDAQQLCFDTKSTVDCATPAGATLGVNGHLSPAGEERRATLDGAAAGGCGVAAASRAPVVCSGMRRFTIHVRYRGTKVRRISVTVNGVKQKVKTLRPRPVVVVSLRGLPTQTTKVKISIRTKAGKLVKGQRVYHPCTKKLPDRGFRL